MTDTTTDTTSADPATSSTGGPSIGTLTTEDLAGAGQSAGNQTASTGTAGDTTTQTAPLFAADDAQAFRSRWQGIQTGFVDEPRQAVQQADSLVAETIKRLAEVFADEHRTLESQWQEGKDVSTEDLRVALRRYRSFFDRLLSI